MATLIPSETGDAAYWQKRMRAETKAALACKDPVAAARHVELATHCLRRALGQAVPGG